MHFIVCMYIQILQNDVEFTGDVVVTEEMEESSTFKFISSSSSHKEMVLKYLGNYISVLVDSFFFHIFFLVIVSEKRVKVHMAFVTLQPILASQ